MTFEQLECFIYAVQENTFFDAAEALHITQSSLSKQIKKWSRNWVSSFLTEASAPRFSRRQANFFILRPKSFPFNIRRPLQK